MPRGRELAPGRKVADPAADPVSAQIWAWAWPVVSMATMTTAKSQHPSLERTVNPPPRGAEVLVGSSVQSPSSSRPPVGCSFGASARFRDRFGSRCRQIANNESSTGQGATVEVSFPLVQLARSNESRVPSGGGVGSSPTGGDPHAHPDP